MQSSHTFATPLKAAKAVMLVMTVLLIAVLQPHFTEPSRVAPDFAITVAA